jgi:ribosomal protein L7/L12
MTLGLILLAGIIGCGIGYLLSRLTNSKKKSQSIPIAVQKSGSIPADVKERVQALVDDGHKIGALKELRDSTDLGLEEAKNIVDSMATSLPINNNADKMGTVRDLLRSGNKMEALELYREFSGMNLKESEEAIDKLEKEFG